MHWIYLSPHFDDAALSCGGMIWEQTRSGETVEIWTICSGSPGDDPLPPFAESLHSRWGTGTDAVEIRNTEDQEACRILNASWHYFDILDCIYRRIPNTSQPVILNEQDLFQPLKLEESYLLISLAKRLNQAVKPDWNLVSPLGVGGHVDHRLTRAAAEALTHTLHYYIEYPYCREDNFKRDEWINSQWQKHSIQISEDGLSAWIRSIAAYKSQLSSFWDSKDAMSREIATLWQMDSGYGSAWKPPGSTE